MTSNSNKSGDEVVDVIAMAKEHEARPERGLVRDLLIHADFSCVIDSNQQLDDLVQFCTNPIDKH
jgi:hypothetical protein